jgi:hypothetical protein
MFHPRGPNFLLSWILAWKNDKEKSSFLQTSGLVLSSIKSWFKFYQDLFKLAFIPLGGSVVNFTEFYKTETGKYEAGIEVKNSLKSS